MTDSAGEDTLRMLADAVDAFARPDAQRTRSSRDAERGFDRSIWEEFGRMGWLAAMLPEARGGLGLGLRAAALIARRLGYAGYLEPYVGAGVVAAACLALCDGDENLSQRLGPILEGKQLVGMAWQPVDGRLDPEATTVVARKESGATRLSGECRFIAVPQASAFVVAARSGSELCLYWTERELAGVDLQLEPAVDGTVLGRMRLTGVALPARALLASGAAARRALECALEAGVVATAAELLGVIERSLEITLEYLKTRQQFGQPIGAFQVLQHRAVDMWIQKELTQAALRSALNTFDDATAGSGARQAAASSVKARASQAALYVCGQAVQLHGAIGFTDEYELGIYVNRALTLAALYGNAAMHRRRYSVLAPVVER